MKLFAALVLSLALSAHATEQEGIAAHAADLATTAMALEMPGLTEGNPLGLLAIPIKVLWHQQIKALPEEHRERGWNLFSAFGWGATTNNLCIMATLNPACLVVGIATGWARWSNGEASWEKAQFDKMCAEARADNPQLVCEYKS